MGDESATPMCERAIAAKFGGTWYIHRQDSGSGDLQVGGGSAKTLTRGTGDPYLMTQNPQRAYPEHIVHSEKRNRKPIAIP